MLNATAIPDRAPARLAPEAIANPEPLIRLLLGFEVSQVLMAAHELGVFRHLVDGPCAPAELCDRVGLPKESGERLLQACTAFNLLETVGNAVRNSSLVRTYLIPGQSTYLGGLVDYYHENIYEACSHMDRAVAENRPQVDHSGGDVFAAMEKQKSLVARFSGAMHNLGLLEGDRLASLYPFNEVSHLLDLGGGSGSLSISLARRHPHLGVTVFDRPAVLDVARTCVEEAGLSSRIALAPGDFWTDPLPQNVDAVLLSMVLHDWDESHGLRLLRRCQEALPSGGDVLIYEQLLNEDRCGPAVTCLTNLTMLLRTSSGSEYTESDYRRQLSEAGFFEIQVRRTAGLRHLIIATKP